MGHPHLCEDCHIWATCPANTKLLQHRAYSIRTLFCSARRIPPMASLMAIVYTPLIGLILFLVFFSMGAKLRSRFDAIRLASCIALALISAYLCFSSITNYLTRDGNLGASFIGLFLAKAPRFHRIAFGDFGRVRPGDSTLLSFASRRIGHPSI